MQLYYRLVLYYMVGRDEEWTWVEGKIDDTEYPPSYTTKLTIIPERSLLLE